MRLKDTIVLRLRIVYLLIALVALIIIVRIFQLQYFSSGYNQVSRYDTLSVYPLRGNIFASNGELLATTQTKYEIRMDLASKFINKDTFNTQVSALADSLSRIFPPETQNDYLKMLNQARNQGKRYKLLKLDVSLDEYNRLKTFPIFRLGRLRGGLIAKSTDKRTLPYKGVALRTIGNVNGVSSIGIEGWYNTHLQGEQETRVVQMISNKEIIVDEDSGSDAEFVLRSGKDIVSTINIQWQDYAHQVLLEQVENIGADTATIVLMEVKTGEIKIMANIIRSPSGKCYERSNFAVAGRIEPGSTFKLASMIVGLEDNKFNINDSVNTGFAGVKRICNYPIEEASGHGYGKLSVKQVFEKSSNIGTATLICNNYKDNPKEFIRGLDNLYLNYRTDIDVHGEAYPEIRLPGKKYWSITTLPQLSIGYESMITPLQMLTFYNAVANDGVYVKPRLVKEIKHYGKTVEKFEPEERKTICDIATIRKVKKMLEGVVERGTAKTIRTNQYKIAGKTGTSQAAFGNKGYYDADSSVIHYGSFAGYFPADKPEFSCIVVLKTKNKHKFYGGTIAAPVFRKIADKVYATSPKFRKKITKRDRNKDVPYSKVGYKSDLNTVYAKLRIPVKGRLNAKSDWINTNEKGNLVEYQVRNIEAGKVPRVVGMGLKDAVFMLESMGLKVRIKGRGTVRQQSLRPGEKLGKGRKIELILR